jgi:hypothetical protein
MNFRWYVLGFLITVTSCGFSGVAERQPRAGGQYSQAWSNAEGRVVGQTTGLLYLLTNPYGDVLRISLPKGRDFKRRQYGEEGGYAITMDRHGHLFESWSIGPSKITEFDRKLQAVRTITLDNNSDVFYSIAVGGDGLLYAGVTGEPYAIQVFSKTASGSAKPIRTISGDQTGISGALALAIDASGELLVANPGNIEVFAPGANGNVAPIRVISGDQTGLNAPFNLAVGADGNVYVANQLPGSGTSFDILVFPSTGNGNLAPIRALQSGAFGYSIALGSGGEMYLGAGSYGQSGAFAIYAAGASGNDQPLGYIGTHYGRSDTPTAFRAALQNAWFFP